MCIVYSKTSYIRKCVGLAAHMLSAPSRNNAKSSGVECVNILSKLPEPFEKSPTFAFILGHKRFGMSKEHQPNLYM